VTDTTLQYLANAATAPVLIAALWGLSKSYAEASNSPVIRAMLGEIIRRHKLKCAGCTALVLVAVGMMLAI
jgi:hypothetical protein